MTVLLLWTMIFVSFQLTDFGRLDTDCLAGLVAAVDYVIIVSFQLTDLGRLDTDCLAGLAVVDFVLIC